MHMAGNIGIVADKELKADKERHLMRAAYMIIVVSLLIASLPASKLATRFMIRQAITISAGPAAKADARKRGAVIALSQKCLPGRPQ